MSESRPSDRWRQVVTIALVLYWAALFIGTHIPQPDLGDLPEHSDKVLHFAGYAGLAFLLGLHVAIRRGRMRWRDYLVVFGITAIYGIVDELLQLIPALNRHGDVYDALADWCGGIIGLVVLFVLLRAWPRLADTREDASVGDER